MEDIIRIGIIIIIILSCFNKQNSIIKHINNNNKHKHILQ
jgi:hypothetical protein